ncbi:MAG: Gfo/Idh/MocA family oxidoreductase [Planctomycetes bacterium]|nr:Gfo/Idh/MocA family oxidoreductase [Planctomycetota bacterium]
MIAHEQYDRRAFIKGAARVAAGALAMPCIVPSTVLGGSGGVLPSNRIVMGCIGMGGRGTGNMKGFMGTGLVQVVSICDVDASRREQAQDIADQTQSSRGCAGYNEIDELVGREDIEAVSIATPDHWHGQAALAAARAGKDIYCEKPLVHKIEEGRALVEAVRRYGRVLQTGSQERSGRGRFGCELVLNGRIGKLERMRTYLPTSNRRCGPQEPEAVPRGFDYDQWLGPAPWAPYTTLRCHSKFRWHRDYSDGELTDRGAHVNDIALWGAQGYLQGPVEIKGVGEFPREGLWNTATAYRIEYRFASGLDWILSSEGTRGIRFEGSEGWIFIHIHGGRMEAEPSSILTSVIGPDEIHLPDSPGHHLNFLQCVRSREDPIAPVEAGQQTATYCHLGNIALLMGRKLKWDPQKELFIGDVQANRMAQRPMRSGWHL